MTTKKPLHSFHIPVMGLAYTMDSPMKVSKYGISSVISIIDDNLAEQMRAFYSQKYNLPYEEIKRKDHDSRALRITNYLNMVDKVVKDKFEKFKIELSESKTTLEYFVGILPNKSEIKHKLQSFLESGNLVKENILAYINEHISHGDIDVNIMTKLDKDNFIKDEQLPIEFNDAHASLRGFANSVLESSIVLSAGMNPRLYSYFESFEDFFPDANGKLKKKIILKVSDYRSAIIQGNFFAKKGLWVSEYRIESGLNCGGHAFATDGYLLGAIMEEFKQKKAELIKSSHEIMVKALELKGKKVPMAPMEMKITVQGGVGTAEEHDFLLNYYNVDSVGWGSPFLLVPEATSVDPDTRKLLANAQEADYYTSDISPLGVPFNTVRGTSNEIIKKQRAAENKSGSSCPKRILALSKEFGPKGICTASKQYQDVKLKELNEKADILSEEEILKEKERLTDKSCLCVGLANAFLIENHIEMKGEAQGVTICPGPNLAYFDKIVSLYDMINHIYGNINLISVQRPNLFIKELQMYVNNLKEKINTISSSEVTDIQIKKLMAYKENLLNGIEYYKKLLTENDCFAKSKKEIQSQLEHYLQTIESISFHQLKPTSL